MVYLRCADVCIAATCFAMSGALGASGLVESRYWVIGMSGCAVGGCVLTLYFRVYQPLLGAVACVIPLFLVSAADLPNEPDMEFAPIKCEYNLGTILGAMMAYQEEHGHLPPTCIADETGRRMHSWRVLLLPYLGYEDIYRRYRFDEPWDGPNNRRLWDERIEVYQCPNDTNARTRGNTSYLAVVGEPALWSGPMPCKAVFYAGLHPRRLLVVELPNTGIRWTEPRDLSADPDHRPDLSRDRLLLSGNHFGGTVNQAIAIPLPCRVAIDDEWTIDELDAWIIGDTAKQQRYWRVRVKEALGQVTHGEVSVQLNGTGATKRDGSNSP